MIIWSSFILDEMAGLRKDALPTCPECKSRPGVPGQEQRRGDRSIQGPDGAQPPRFGEIVSWAIADAAPTDPAEKFVEYMMTDGYVRWIEHRARGQDPGPHGDQARATRRT